MAIDTITEDPAVTDVVVPVDRAAYLKKELDNRVQTEPELFDFIIKAALDGIWYVRQADAVLSKGGYGTVLLLPS